MKISVSQTFNPVMNAHLLPQLLSSKSKRIRLLQTMASKVQLNSMPRHGSQIYDYQMPKESILERRRKELRLCK